MNAARIRWTMFPKASHANTTTATTAAATKCVKCRGLYRQQLHSNATTTSFSQWSQQRLHMPQQLQRYQGFSSTSKSHKTRRSRAKTANNNSSANNAKKKMTTTRQRMRRLVEHNQVDPASISGRRGSSATDMFETAASRVEWARDSVYKVWNPDYGTSRQLQDLNPKFRARQEHLARTGALQRYGTANMNIKWWFWNIVLMLTPATLIHLYCQIIGKPQMWASEIARRRAQLEELADQGYLTDDEVELELEVWMEEQKLRRHQEEQEGKLWRVLSELYIVLTGGELDEKKADGSSMGLGAASDLLQHRPASTIDPAVSTTTSTSASSPVEPQSQNPIVDTDTSTNNNINTTTAVSLEQLMQRIQSLESKVNQTEHQKQKRMEFERKRQDQSGINNRKDETDRRELMERVQRLRQQQGTGENPPNREQPNKPDSNNSSNGNNNDQEKQGQNIQLDLSQVDVTKVLFQMAKKYIQEKKDAISQSVQGILGGGDAKKNDTDETKKKNNINDSVAPSPDKNQIVPLTLREEPTSDAMISSRPSLRKHSTFRTLKEKIEEKKQTMYSQSTNPQPQQQPKQQRDDESPEKDLHTQHTSETVQNNKKPWYKVW